MGRAGFFVGLVMMATVLTAYAEFRVFVEPEEPSASPHPAKIRGERLRFAGPPLFLERGTGDPPRIVPEPGRGVTVEQALGQLLPYGWTATVHPSAANFAVSWEGGHSWLQLMRTILNRIGADTLVDWPKRRVVIGPEVREAWTLEPGSLRANLEVWARRAGWRFQWAVPSYSDLTVPYPAVLPLGLDMKQAVQLLVDSYRKERTLNLKADLYEVNLLIVLRCDRGGC